MLVDKYGNPLRAASEDRYSPITPTADRIRQTTDRPSRFGPFSNFTGREYTQATDKVDWKLTFLNEETLCTKSASEIVEILIHSSPDLSRARTDMQMLLNTGFTLTTVEADDAAQAILDESLLTMEYLKEPMSVKLNKCISSMFLKGAIYTECLFNGPPGAQYFVDIRIVDPFRIAYRTVESEERGQYEQFGEVRDNEFVPIESDLVQYIPINPVDNHPLGIPMIGSAIFPIIFLMGVLKSLRQVIETQAWPQGLITIDGEKYLKSKYGDSLSSNPGALKADEVKADLQNLTEDIENRFANASKSEIFIYGAEVGYQIIGAMGKTNLDAVEMVKQVLDQWILRATKQYSLTFGLNDGNALSTNADQQSELLARQGDALQTELERPFNIHFTQILRNAGSLATPIFKLNRFNALVEEKRAQKQKIKTETLKLYLEMRLVTQQEGRNILRDPAVVPDLSQLLDPELPEELIALPEPTEDPNTDTNEEDTDTDTEDTDPEEE